MLQNSSGIFPSTEAMDFLLHHPVDPLDVAEFEKSCGVGVVITHKMIADMVSSPKFRPNYFMVKFSVFAVFLKIRSRPNFWW